MRNIIFFMPNIERGGIEKNLIILSDYFIKKKFKVHIIYGYLSKEISTKLNKKIKLIEIKSYLFSFLNFRIKNSLSCFIYLLFCRKFLNKDLILSMQDHPFPIVVSIIKNIKCFIRIANHPTGSLKFYNNYFFFNLKFFIKKFFYRFASGIICNSNASKKCLKREINNKKIITIYNPTNFRKYKQNYKRKNQIISVGRLQNQKNFLGLIESFEKIKHKIENTKLIIIGSGSEYKKIKSLQNKYKLNKRLVIQKYKNPISEIKKSKLFILNSLWEGLPNILLETQNLKTPILSTNCLSGPSEILKNGKFGYLTPVNNINLLAKKIIFIFNNYEEAKSKALKGYLNLSRFDCETQCKKYEKFITEN